jgi:hypothetical protein
MPLRCSAELEPSAIAFLDGCSDENEVRHIRSLIEEIRLDPNVDEREKIALVVPPAVFRVLQKDGYWIPYQMVGAAHLRVLTIARGPTRPPV